MSSSTDPAELLAGPRGAQLRLGLAIKQAEQAMMAAKAEALRGLELTVPQYAVLLQLADRPDRSGAQLARGPPSRRRRWPGCWRTWRPRA
ncbi:hypothetical protein ACFQ0T_33010 [Kitasatospora gansuensis]